MCFEGAAYFNHLCLLSLQKENATTGTSMLRDELGDPLRMGFGWVFTSRRLR